MKKPDGKGLWWWGDLLMEVHETLARNITPQRYRFCYGDWRPVSAFVNGDWRRVLTPIEMDEIAAFLADAEGTTPPDNLMDLETCAILLRGEEASDE